MSNGDAWKELEAARARLRALIGKPELTPSSVRDAWLALLAETRERPAQPRSRRLCCVECGRRDPADERGWTLRLDEDEELQAFCPECDEREFGHGS